MTTNGSMTVDAAAASLGVAASTLRWQIRNGKLRATKVGPMWFITTREVERYRRDSRRPGIVRDDDRRHRDTPA